MAKSKSTTDIPTQTETSYTVIDNMEFFAQA